MRLLFSCSTRRLVMITAVLAIVSLSLTDGFSPSTGFTTTTRRRSPRTAPSVTHHARRRSWSPLAASTVENERLSDVDEEILFGGSGTETVGKSATTASGGSGGKPSPMNPLDRAQDPLVNELTAMRATLQSCPGLWLRLADICPTKRALLDEHLCDETIDLTFADMKQQVLQSARVFQQLGVKKGVNVALLAENAARWLLLDHGIQMAGGASAVRGADAPVDELRYIYQHSDSAGIVVLQGPKLLKKLGADGKAALGLSNEAYGPVKTAVLMNVEKATADDLQEMSKQYGVQVLAFDDLLQQATPLEENKRPVLAKDDLATIVYTSGTTGSPKGVMLTHGNLIHQTGHRLTPTKPFEEGEPLPGETMVSILPVWHITERVFELWIASRGCNVVYSSIRTLKNDLAKHKPQWMVLVPRVLEKIAAGVQDKFASGGAVVSTLSKLFTTTSSTAAQQRKVANGMIQADVAPSFFQKLQAKATVAALAPLNAVGSKLVWKKVQEGFGGNIKVIISGGSALAGSLEAFYEAAGLTVCVGYGLTECSPLISFRRADSNFVTAGCTGKACHDTELRVVDPDLKPGDSERPSLPPGQAGVVITRGPQVTKGYYKNPEATAAAIDKFGWFDTGDLGKINPCTGDLILTGRAKDTIVLSNGENIEPTPIEDALLESPLIEQVMLTGQDGRRLLAICVLSPKELANAGLVDKSDAAAWQAANEKLNDPKCTVEECQDAQALLVQAARQIRSDTAIQQAVVQDCKRLSKPFRQWEQVSDAFLTLEPFCMVNGELTQSYKVKRASVLERYQDEF